ncbi:MAG: hypothetical protein ACRC6X_03815 [Culicoidibacterales bacterium]
MKKIQDNIFLVMTTAIVLVLSVVQGINSLVVPQDIVLLANNFPDTISQALEVKQGALTYENDYLTLALPRGMQLYAVDQNNIKIRSQQGYYEAHTFISAIDTVQYGRKKFQTPQEYTLTAVDGTNYVIFVKDTNSDYLSLGLFSNRVEITTRVHKSKFEQALLESIQIIKNINPKINEEMKIFIEGNQKPNASSPSSDGGYGEGQGEEGTQENKILLNKN